MNDVAEKVSTWARMCPWTSMVGLARTVLAAGTLLTLLATDQRVLLSPLADGTVPPVCTGAARAGLWCLVPDDQRWLAVFVSVAVLVVVIAGWRPRFTGLPHWWVVWSFTTAVTLQDGGDQVAAVITLLLLPVTLTDPRRWHWSRGPALAESALPGWPWLVARMARVLLLVQVAAIYLHSAIAKLGVAEWADGTALWYWLRNPQFGAAGWLSPLTDRLIMAPAAVTLLTWGAIALEFLLGAALFMRPFPRRVLLVAGLGLHASIMATMGLVSFFCSMAAALILYLTPVGQELDESWPARLVTWLRAQHSSAIGEKSRNLLPETTG
ncbi:sporulation-delaying protein SdpB family protein [Asanoa hainanensis]|uniref:sporulation-delaying protein SdpB family protein n=1 Tax=Asanoa hainanensis TaxID=560556 RepID=UPI000B78C460|nr:sporulation-delaying protein SdpB family protein [Asanoa hainanensis]